MEKKPIVLLILMCLAFPVMADDSSPVITLDEAIASADVNSISLQQARVNLNQAIRNQDAVMTTFMPDISLTAGVSTGWDFPGAPESMLNPTSRSDFGFNGLDISAGATASFSFNGSMIKDGQLRSYQKEGAMLSYEQTYQSLESLIVDAYWNLAAGDLSLKAAELSYEDAKSQYDMVNDMYNSGLADELSLKEAEIGMKQAELQVKSLRDSNALLMSSFKNVTGITGDFAPEKMPELPVLTLPSAEELFAEYGDSSLDVRVAVNTLNSAKTAKDNIDIASFVPIITTSVGYSYAGAVGSDYQWDNYRHTAHGVTGSVMVSLPLSSLLPGSSTDMTRKDAADSVTLASLNLQDTKNTLLEDIRQAVMTIDQAEASLSIQRSTAETMQQAYDLAEESYQAGLTTMTDLNTRRNELLSAQIGCLSSELTKLNAVYDLSYLLDISIDEILEKYSSEQN